MPAQPTEAEALLAQLCQRGDPKNVAGMARFGIAPHHALGIKIPELRALAKQTGVKHELALELWQSGIHEARILASMIADPQALTEQQIEQWTRDFDAWDVCDQVCMNLYRRHRLAYGKAIEWSSAAPEFVKRAGFSLMATLAVGDKRASDAQFAPFFECILAQAGDERNYVKKAVNWALRQMGKRNPALRKQALLVCDQLLQRPSRPARWIAQDARRELLRRPQ